MTDFVIVLTRDANTIPTFKRIHHIRDGQTHCEAGEGLELQLRRGKCAGKKSNS
jgi:hypothetical protein